MKNELRNIDIHILSLVDKGANQKTIIWKSNSALDTYKRSFDIKKKDDAKRIVYGIVYSPDQIDAHGDYASAEEVEKACYLFMKNSRTTQVDTQHDLNTNQDCYVGENWIVKESDALFPEELGAWATGIKVENDEIWDQITKGDITGISMYGVAEKIAKSGELDKEDSTFLKRLRKLFDTDTEDEMPIVKDFQERVRALTFRTVVQAFMSELDNIIYTTYSDEASRRKAIDELVNDFTAKLDEIETAKSLTMKAGKMISDANMTKLQNAITAIQSIIDAANNTKKSFQNNNQGDSEMTQEEIQKQIDDAIKIVADKNDSLKQENDELKKRIEALEKESKGSSQAKDDDEVIEKKETKKAFNWLG